MVRTSRNCLAKRGPGPLLRQDEGCYNWQHNKLWFPLYEILLQTGTIVTEATYRFDIVKSNHESPFKDL
jgi:hypothetical protein